jgi:E3 ubiquitin-protein ligase HECTD2
MSEMDAKTLLLGDFAENGSWWTGERSEMRSPERARTQRVGNSHESVTLKSPRIDWSEMNEWYKVVVEGGRRLQKRIDDLTESGYQRPPNEILVEIEDEVLEAQSHAQRVLLKATESLLKRPGRLLSEPNDLRFLLIILANPLLYPVHSTSKSKERSRSRSTGVAMTRLNGVCPPLRGKRRMQGKEALASIPGLSRELWVYYQMSQMNAITIWCLGSLDIRMPSFKES